MQSQKHRIISVHFQGKPFNIIVIEVYAPSTNAKEAERFYEDLRTSRTNSKKWCPFHYRGLECESRKSRDTWSNRQIWSGNKKWSKAKANRENTGHIKHPLPITQEMTLRIDVTDGPHQNQIGYILCSQRGRSSIQLAKTRPGHLKT